MVGNPAAVRQNGCARWPKKPSSRVEASQIKGDPKADREESPKVSPVPRKLGINLWRHAVDRAIGSLSKLVRGGYVALFRLKSPYRRVALSCEKRISIASANSDSNYYLFENIVDLFLRVRCSGWSRNLRTANRCRAALLRSGRTCILPRRHYQKQSQRCLPAQYPHRF